MAMALLPLVVAWKYPTLQQGGSRLFPCRRSRRAVRCCFSKSLVWCFPPRQDLQLYLSNLANQIDRETSTSEIPLVIILDDINDPISISELVNGALTCKYHKWYVPLRPPIQHIHNTWPCDECCHNLQLLICTHFLTQIYTYM